MAEEKQAICVVVNGEEQRLNSVFSIADLLVHMKIHHAAIAVEINGEIAASGSFEETTLQEADVIEIVSLVGGG